MWVRKDRVTAASHANPDGGKGSALVGSICDFICRKPCEVLYGSLGISGILQLG